MSEVRDQTCVLMNASQICFCWATTGTPLRRFKNPNAWAILPLNPALGAGGPGIGTLEVSRWYLRTKVWVIALHYAHNTPRGQSQVYAQLGDLKSAGRWKKKKSWCLILSSASVELFSYDSWFGFLLFWLPCSPLSVFRADIQTRHIGTAVC